MCYYGGDVLSYITDGNNNLRYSFGRDVNGELLTMTDHTAAPAKTYTYIKNYRGDVTGMYDTNGVKVASYTYESFGRITNQIGSGLTGEGKPLFSENPFKYASYFHDQETNYYYLMARYYDPAQGRFLTKDPVDNTNLYRYVSNSPMMAIDYNGNFVILLPFIPAISAAFLEAIVGITAAVGGGLYVGSKITKTPTVTTSSSFDPTKYPWSELPKSGDYPFVPPVDKAGNPIYKKDPLSGGAVDKNGKDWSWDKTGTKVGNPHWDVKYKKGKHTNVNPKGNGQGKVNHGPDNMRKK